MRKCLLFTVIVLMSAAFGVSTGDAASQEELPGELQDYKVRDSFFPSVGKPVGVIQSVLGRVVVAREASGGAYTGRPGDRLYERDTLYTLKGARCRFKLNSEDVITMGEGTRIAIARFYEDRTAREKKSAFRMARGKAMFYTMKLLRYKSASTLVETPTAVAGVRGTKWGVEVIELAGKPTASLPVMVADLSDMGFRQLAQAGQSNFQTNVYGFEGQVNVTSTVTGQSTTLSGGQGINAAGTGLGSTFITPPGVAQQFMSDTNVPNGAGGGTTGTTATATMSKTTGGNNTDTNDPPNTSTVAQNQTANAASSSPPSSPSSSSTDPSPDPGKNASGGSVGYVSGMLTNQTGAKIQDIFVSTKRQDFAAGIWARGSQNPGSDYVRVDSGQNWSDVYDAYAKWAVFDSGTRNSDDLGTGHPVSHTTVDFVILNSPRFEWGYWTMTDAFTVEGSDYVFDNRGWWINGPNTPGVSGLSGSARYSGNAYGTYWTSSGGMTMTGSFSSDVNFDTGAISNFGLSVNAYFNDIVVASASITGASGSIGSDAHFEITGGSWYLNGTNPSYKMAYGSLYDDSAGHIGGAWGMATSEAAAVGIYEGGKYTQPSAHAGYFAMMLTNKSSNSFNSFLLSKESSGHQNFDGVMSADDPFVSASPATMTLEGGSTYAYDRPGITALKTNGPIGGGGYNLTVGIPVQMQPPTGGGSNPYLEWGEWTQPEVMTGCPNFIFNNKGYYIAGDVTPDARMADLAARNMTATYTGTANGTYWTSTGTNNSMSGTFSSIVNFGSGAVSNFNVDVSGNGYAAKILGGSGSLSSSAGQMSHFNITSATTVTLTGSTTNSAAAYGSLYGSDAQAIGGIWAVKGTGKQAVGVFQGLR